MPLPPVFAWSGGIDSAMALHSLLDEPRYKVVWLLTTVTESFERISMHGVRRELLHQQRQSIGLPVEEVRIPPPCPNAIYRTRMAEAVLWFHDNGVRCFGFGDIFLQDLHAYREQNRGHLELCAIFPLWDIDTRELATRFVRDGFHAFTACIDPRRLDKSFAGRELRPEVFSDLPAGIDPCGENGEFHTFVFDGPSFRSPIPARIGDVVVRDAFFFWDWPPDPYRETLCSAR